MDRRQTASTARATRVVRLLWPDDNPLRRTVDRIEAAIATALTVAFLVAAPFVATLTSHVAYGDGVRAAAGERAAWHQVRAVLLARPVAADFSGQPQAPARWIASGGARHTGLVPAPQGALPGSTVRVWTDAAGWLTGPPLTPIQVRTQEVVAAVLAPVALGLIILGAGTLAHYLLGRRRMAAWDDEWRATGPKWTTLR